MRNSTIRASLGIVALLVVSVGTSIAQPVFAVASIRPSAESVKFEHDGKTTTSPGHLLMRDVTVSTCIKWAYGVQSSQVSGPDSLDRVRYDIEAKADGPASIAEMKLMMQALLADRFKLTFHREDRKIQGFALTVAKGGSKLHRSAGDGESYRQNSATGMVAKFMTMQAFADFLGGPLEAPVTDQTGLEGKYDFTLDFAAYLPVDEPHVRPDLRSILITALQDEIGLKLEAQKVVVEVLAIDHLEKPSEN